MYEVCEHYKCPPWEFESASAGHKRLAEAFTDYYNEKLEELQNTR